MVYCNRNIFDTSFCKGRKGYFVVENVIIRSDEVEFIYVVYLNDTLLAPCCIEIRPYGTHISGLGTFEAAVELAKIHQKKFNKRHLFIYKVYNNSINTIPLE